MSKVNLRDYQLFQLEILKEFARICEKNKLTWCMAYGTLLGAVRHKGFIPWDDDIDVWMKPSDYLAFREACKSDLSDDFYLQCHALNPANYIGWQRIGVKNSTSLLLEHADIPMEWGVCMDIFALQPAPAPEDPARTKHIKDVSRFAREAKRYLYKHDAKKLSGLPRLYHIFMGSGNDAADAARWLEHEKRLLEGTEWVDSGYLEDSLFPEYLFSAADFDEMVLLEYEGMMLPAPKGYESVLAKCYGDDWAETPPEENRVCHSGGGSSEVLVCLDRPYTDFLA